MKTARSLVSRLSPILLCLGPSTAEYSPHPELHIVPTWLAARDSESATSMNVYDYDEKALKPWLEHMRQKKGWIFASGRVIEVDLISVNLGAPVPERTRRDLTVSFRLPRDFGNFGTFGIFSFDPLPAQTWRFVSDDVVETTKGRFRIEHRKALHDSEFVEYDIRLLRRSTSAGWQVIHQFKDQGVDWTADVTGDGVPEIVGATGYKDIGVWQVFPTFSLLAINKSGA